MFCPSTVQCLYLCLRLRRVLKKPVTCFLRGVSTAAGRMLPSTGRQARASSAHVGMLKKSGVARAAAWATCLRTCLGESGWVCPRSLPRAAALATPVTLLFLERWFEQGKHTSVYQRWGDGHNYSYQRETLGSILQGAGAPI